MSPQRQKYLAVFISLLAGTALATMIRLNATLGQHIGILESSFVVHVTGSLFAILILNRRLNKKFISDLKKPPKHLYIAGVLGVIIVLMGNYLVPRLGLALTISLFISCGLVFSTIADHLGVMGLQRFPITLKRVAGLILSICGVLFIVWG